MQLDKEKVEVYKVLADILLKLILGIISGIILAVGFGYMIYFICIKEYIGAGMMLGAETGIYLIIARPFKHYFFDRLG